MRKKFLSKLTKPVKNKKAVGVLDVIFSSLFMVVLAYLIAYSVTAIQHEGIRRKIDMNAGSMLDAISENRELTPAMQAYYKRDIDKAKWYIGDYTIRYKTISFVNGGAVETTLGVSDAGQSIGTFSFNKGTIVRIEIVSQEDTALTQITRLMHGDGVAQVVGYAEGSVD